jgi:DNA-binding IclR family transcriptional regulator
MPVLPEPAEPQQEQQLQQELAELREQLTQVRRDAAAEMSQLLKLWISTVSADNYSSSGQVLGRVSAARRLQPVELMFYTAEQQQARGCPLEQQLALYTCT